LHVRFWHICVAVYCVPWVAVSCSVLQCVAVCCSILHDGILRSGSSFDPGTSRSICYRVILGHRNHWNDPASVFLSTHGWSQHPACQHWLFLVISCFFKPLRNCHPSQWVSKLQCKKPAKKIIQYWDVMLTFLGDFMLIFQEILWLRDVRFFKKILRWFLTRSRSFYPGKLL